MKKTLVPALVLGALCALWIAAPSTAQPPLGGPHMHGRGGPMDPEALADYLSLTEAQKTQVEKIREKTRTVIEPLLAEQKKLMDAVRTALDNEADAATVGAAVIAAHEQGKKIRALHDESDTEIEALLTAEQLTRWQALKDARKMMAPPIFGLGGPPRG